MQIISGLSTDTDVSFVGLPPATSTAGYSGTWVIFKIFADGQPVGPYFSGWAQESFTNWINYWNVDGVGEDGPDIPWAPNGGDARFYLDTTTGDQTGPCALIYDFKVLAADQKYGTLPNGVLASYTQDNRVYYTDLKGQTIYCDLGTVNLNTVKTGTSLFQVQQ
jgi:hypothetical protein